MFKDMEDELKIDYEQFMSWVEQTMKRYGSAIPVPKFLSKGKRSQITRLVKEAGSKKLLEEAIVNMAKSDILNGRVRRRDFPKGFLGSLPWLLANDERIFDVANGKFDNPPEQLPTAAELRAQAEEERRQREEQRREESRRIEAEERERKRRERDAMFAGAVHGEELEKIWAQISLPPLEKPNDEKKLRNRPPNPAESQ